jgi:hypothetical protein
MKLCLISLLVLFTFVDLANACAPPYPSYRLHLTVKYGNSLVSGASVFIFETDKSTPIQHAYTDTWGKIQFSLGPKKYNILVIWSSTCTIKKDVLIPFAGEYLTIDITSTIPETTVLDKCHNWLPWTLGILSISLIIGTFIIALALDTTWKEAIGCSILVNVPSVMIGILLCLLL